MRTGIRCIAVLAGILGIVANVVAAEHSSSVSSPDLVGSDNYLGEYFSDSEADCDIHVALREAGIGEATQICVTEDERHKHSVVKFPLNWRVDGNSVFILYSDYAIELSYEKLMPCNRPEVRLGIGLALKSKGQNILGGYGNMFWKKSGGCI